MKPHKHIRKGKGYCCEWDDGPYNKWKKRTHRAKKRSDRQKAKKELRKTTQ